MKRGASVVSILLLTMLLCSCSSGTEEVTAIDTANTAKAVSLTTAPDMTTISFRTTSYTTTEPPETSSHKFNFTRHTEDTEDDGWGGSIATQHTTTTKATTTTEEILLVIGFDELEETTTTTAKTTEKTSRTSKTTTQLDTSVMTQTSVSPADDSHSQPRTLTTQKRSIVTLSDLSAKFGDSREFIPISPENTPLKLLSKEPKEFSADTLFVDTDEMLYYMYSNDIVIRIDNVNTCLCAYDNKLIIADLSDTTGSVYYIIVLDNFEW